MSILDTMCILIHQHHSPDKKKHTQIEFSCIIVLSNSAKLNSTLPLIKEIPSAINPIFLLHTHNLTVIKFEYLKKLFYATFTSSSENLTQI